MKNKKLRKIDSFYTIIPTITVEIEKFKIKFVAFYKYIYEFHIKRKCWNCEKKNTDVETYTSPGPGYIELGEYCEICDKRLRDSTEEEKRKWQNHLDEIYGVSDEKI
jgi:hypothetical protein